MAKRETPGMPTRQQILDFITSAPGPAGKREIARAFGLHGAEKIALKSLLKDMGDEGLIDSAPGRAFHKMGGLPKVTVLRVIEAEDDQVIAIPEHWEAEGKPPPRLRVIEGRGRRSALGVGDRILARTEEKGAGHVAHPMKQLARGEDAMLGVLDEANGRFWLRPVDKRIRRETPVSDVGGAVAGQLVLAERSGRGPRVTAKVTDILGDSFAPRSFSLIAIHKHGIPDVFSDEVLDDATKAAGFALGDREDLRHLPIIAIDPADARDHDDAVWAAPRDDGGFDAIVAIADVSFYVRPGSALDREAKKRGNSTYFPDRVVPMLPELLSADVCSLKAGEDRAALACHLKINAQGVVTASHFTRAVIRVAANIAYEDAQAMIDAESGVLAETQRRGGEDLDSRSGNASPMKGSDFSAPLRVSASPREPELLSSLTNLWACWRFLKTARDKRGPLELNLPERRVVLDDEGRIASVALRKTLDANRLIEDFMIAANVAAAKALEAKKAPCMYRDHEPPSREKLVALKDYLATFGMSFALGQVITPGSFNRLIEQAATLSTEALPQIMEQILRTQTQAYYAPANQGHFGLALGSYAHFTSPIRRYADLLVHRSLVESYGLGAGGLSRDEAARMTVLGEAISAAERRSMEAERETIDRYVAAYLAERVGELVEARITGVTGFGFFATVEGLGGDGLVPAASLGDEYFRHDEASRSLIGADSGETYTLGQRLALRLVEADPISGALRFALPDGDAAPARRGPPVRHRRGRPGNIRHQGRRR